MKNFFIFRASLISAFFSVLFGIAEYQSIILVCNQDYTQGFFSYLWIFPVGFGLLLGLFITILSTLFTLDKETIFRSGWLHGGIFDLDEDYQSVPSSELGSYSRQIQRINPDEFFRECDLENMYEKFYKSLKKGEQSIGEEFSTHLKFSRLNLLFWRHRLYFSQSSYDSKSLTISFRIHKDPKIFFKSVWVSSVYENEYQSNFGHGSTESVPPRIDSILADAMICLIEGKKEE